MARICEICGKGPATGNNVSHAHNKNRRRWLPNLQKVRTYTDSGSVVRINACTRCIRSGAVVKPACRCFFLIMDERVFNPLVLFFVLSFLLSESCWSKKLKISG